MRVVFSSLVLLLATATVGAAQTPPDGYFVLGRGGWSGGFGSGGLGEIAGGGEKFVTRTMALGAEVGIVGSGDVAALTVSPSATYRFADTTRTTPFLRAGYTLLGVDGLGAGGPNIGGGVVRWFGNGGGIVFEFRDVIYHAYETEQWWTFRVGFTFR